MKILNLHAALGSNRKHWKGHEITAVELNPTIAKVYADLYPNDKLIIGDAYQYLLDHYHEFDFIWASPPCQSHSRARYWSSKPNKKVKPVFPDMKLYEVILFLKHYYNGLWAVENVFLIISH